MINHCIPFGGRKDCSAENEVEEAGMVRATREFGRWYLQNVAFGERTFLDQQEEGKNKN